MRRAGFSSLARINELNNPDVVARPLDGCATTLTTYLVRREGNPAEQLARFIGRVSPEESQALLPDHTSQREIA